MSAEPAFPSPQVTTPDGRVMGPFAGMTLRDYFAAKAMQAMVNARMVRGEITEAGHLTDAAHLSYDMADEMMEAREDT